MNKALRSIAVTLLLTCSLTTGVYGSMPDQIMQQAIANSTQPSASAGTFTLNGSPTATTINLDPGDNVVTLSHTIPAGNLVVIYTSQSNGVFISSCTAASSTCVVGAGANSCNRTGTSPVGSLSCAYILSAGTALTTITITMPTVSSSGIYIADWSITSGHTVTVAGACNTALTSSTSLTSCATTLGGANYVLVAGLNCAQTCSTASGTGWTNSQNLNGNATALKTNTAVNTAPTFPSSPAGAAISAMIAFLAN